MGSPGEKVHANLAQCLTRKKYPIKVSHYQHDSIGYHQGGKILGNYLLLSPGHKLPAFQTILSLPRAPVWSPAPQTLHYLLSSHSDSWSTIPPTRTHRHHHRAPEPPACLIPKEGRGFLSPGMHTALRTTQHSPTCKGHCLPQHPLQLAWEGSARCQEGTSVAQPLHNSPTPHM